MIILVWLYMQTIIKLSPVYIEIDVNGKIVKKLNIPGLIYLIADLISLIYCIGYDISIIKLIW